jgi:hypothetical protein
MRIFQASIHTGIGDIIMAKTQIEPLKHKFDRIELSFSQHWLNMHDQNYANFLKDLWKLLFTDPVYALTEQNYPLLSPLDFHNQGFTLQEPSGLENLLCNGAPLNLDKEYIVLTTKIRYLSRTKLNSISNELWNTINSLSGKYKIVILGERIVEMSPEYVHHTSEQIFSMYVDIICNIPSDKLIDLSVPALGITSPDLKQFQQDCLIMKNAKCVITLGVGGNFCMATAVANTVGYRQDGHDIFEIIYNRGGGKAAITKDFSKFISTLKQYL